MMEIVESLSVFLKYALSVTVVTGRPKTSKSWFVKLRRFRFYLKLHACLAGYLPGYGTIVIQQLNVCTIREYVTV